MEKLKVSIGKTYNTGNYTSIRIDIGLEVETAEITTAYFDDIFADVENLLVRAEKKRGLK